MRMRPIAVTITGTASKWAQCGGDRRAGGCPDGEAGGTTLVPRLWSSSARPVGAERTDRNAQSREDRTDHGAGERADDEGSKGRSGHGRRDHVRSTKECGEQPRRGDTSADRGREGSKTHRSDDAGDSVQSISADSRELAETLLAAVGVAAFQ